jgi:hypothetical protein
MLRRKTLAAKAEWKGLEDDDDRKSHELESFEPKGALTVARLFKVAVQFWLFRKQNSNFLAQ